MPAIYETAMAISEHTVCTDGNTPVWSLESCLRRSRSGSTDLATPGVCYCTYIERTPAVPMTTETTQSLMFPVLFADTSVVSAAGANGGILHGP